MDALSVAVLAGAVLAWALLSRWLDQRWITVAIVMVTAGWLLGSDRLGWFDPVEQTAVVRIAAEATLALVLFGDASRIAFGRLRRESGLPARLLLVGLPLTIVVGALLGAPLLGLSGTAALVLAIVLAPTDAALGQAVVADPRLPRLVRDGLNVESGLNDGLCVPLLVVALAADTEGASTGMVRQLVDSIGWGVTVGLVVGVGVAGLVRLARAHGTVDREWAVLVPVLAAGLAYGAADRLGGSPFIATFVAGMAFGARLRGVVDETGGLLDDLGRLLDAVTFFLFGAAVVGLLIDEVTWSALLYALLSLTVVRLVPVAIALIGTGLRWPTVGFVGWFGPRGLASIVFTIAVIEESDLGDKHEVVVVATLTVLLSVFAHGLSARPFVARYGRWVARTGDASADISA